MAKIEIKDLPKDYKVTEDEMKRIRGGALSTFLKIDDVKGESTDRNHKDWAEII